MNVKLAHTTIICHLIAVTRRPLMLLTLLFVTMLSLNRYYAIAKADKAETLFSHKKSWVYVTSIWTLTLVSLIIPLLYGNRVLLYSNLLGNCFYVDRVAANVLKIFLIVCMVTMAYCNVKMWYAVRQHNVAMSGEIITVETSRERNLNLNELHQ